MTSDDLPAIMNLDVAWALAEAALPDHWYIRSLTLLKHDLWEVVCVDGNRMQFARGRTPAEAVINLAAAFRP